MANYIDKQILAEAYTHLDIEIFEDKERLEKLKIELISFFKERASFIFETDVEILVEFEEGSLKTKIIAIGSVATVIAGVVCNYASFKDGIKQLANDAAAIAQSANIEVIFRTKTPYCDRLRIEKRKGIFGKVQSLLAELESISGDVDESKLPTEIRSLENENKIIEKLVRWGEKADVMFEKLEAGDAQACVAEGLIEEMAKFPRDFPWQENLGSSTLTRGLIESDGRLSLEIFGASARYKAALAAITTRLNQRVEQNANLNP